MGSGGSAPSPVSGYVVWTLGRAQPAPRAPSPPSRRSQQAHRRVREISREGGACLSERAAGAQRVCCEGSESSVRSVRSGSSVCGVCAHGYTAAGDVWCVWCACGALSPWLAATRTQAASVESVASAHGQRAARRANGGQRAATPLWASAGGRGCTGAGGGTTTQDGQASGERRGSGREGSSLRCCSGCRTHRDKHDKDDKHTARRARAARAARARGVRWRWPSLNNQPHDGRQQHQQRRRGRGVREGSVCVVSECVSAWVRE